MPISTIDQKGLTNPLTSVAANTVASASGSALTLQTNGSTTAVTIDTSQNVGIGNTSPSTFGRFVVQDSGSGGGTITAISSSASNAIYIKNTGTEARFSYNDLYPMTFATNSTERMRITSTGRVFINTTSEAGSNDSQVTIKQNEGAGFYRCLSLETVVSTNRIIQSFINTNGIVGTINTYGSATTYNTSSDYRLKENIAPMTGALTTVAQLKPVTYKWKVDGSDGQGFIAHELQEVVAGCVSGEKDAVDKNGNPEYQGIDTSFLVATLTAAIQELKAEFDAYKASHP
jgi:hypothetical protein